MDECKNRHKRKKNNLENEENNGPSLEERQKEINKKKRIWKVLMSK